MWCNFHHQKCPWTFTHTVRMQLDFVSTQPVRMNVETELIHLRASEVEYSLKAVQTAAH